MPYLLGYGPIDIQSTRYVSGQEAVLKHLRNLSLSARTRRGIRTPTHQILNLAALPLAYTGKTARLRDDGP